MSGHAILASHFDADSQLLGKDGYFIRGDPRPEIRNRYRFAENDPSPCCRQSPLGSHPNSGRTRNGGDAAGIQRLSR